MAAELRSPLLPPGPQRRRGLALAVAAAAPLLALLLAVVVFSRSLLTDGTKLFFRGLRIWEAVVDELMTKGMDTAEKVFTDLVWIDLSGERSMRSLISGAVHLQNVREVLPKVCLQNKDPAEIFILHVAGFKRKLVSELKVAENNKNWGLFIDSCFTHCQTPFTISWHSPISPRLGNKVSFESLNHTWQ
ncbi:hypothetical protein HU200_054997 [Digitaria exilis]|uniref:Pectin acetylesterase n=1 Tax=Digitaria exilis TaxID=1010633 RepID=A0A835AJW0_9POAL|nr:hypothetical protein HU200_054997 [Digitaria exilis]